MDTKDVRIDEVHLQPNGGFQVIARIETGLVSAQFRVGLSRFKRRHRHSKTIEELTEETREKVVAFCRELGS